MRVEVRAGESDDELRSLYRWLTEDLDLRSADISLSDTPPAAGEMGAGVEFVQVVLTNVWSAGSLVTAVAAWRQARPRSARTVLRVGRTEVEVTGDDAEQVHRYVTALRAAEAENLSDGNQLPDADGGAGQNVSA